MTKIVLCLLLTYWNNEENDSFDPWKPEPIAPAYSWPILRKTFDYILQITNGKSLIELLLKTTDLGDILLCLSSKIFFTSSIHEHLRLLDAFGLFLTEILLKSLDHAYLHSVLRDSTYILLRYIEKYAERKSLEVYQAELQQKILRLICELLHRLCLRGLEFDASVYLHHLPDLVRILIDHQQSLGKARLQPILRDIHRAIGEKTELIWRFISHAIEKL